MASSGLEALPLLGSACDERDGAHLAEDLAIVEVIDRHTGRPAATASAATWSSPCSRRTTSCCATISRTSCAGTRSRARAARRTGVCSTKAACATSSPSAAARSCRSTWRWCCTSSPRSRTPSAEYQIVRHKPPSEALHVRLEYDPAQVSDIAGITRRLRERFRERLDVAVQLDLVARGDLPRFAYKAARVVDE